MLIPSINYTAAFSNDDYVFYRDTIESELLTRMLLSMGLGNSLSFGIVDTAKPSNIDSSQVSRPLVVTQNQGSPLKVDAHGGWVVFESGTWMQVSSTQEIAMADSTVGVTNFVIAEYAIVDGGQNRKTVYNTDAWTLGVRSNSIYANPDVSSPQIKTITLDQWNDTTVFTVERKKNIIVLASVAVVNSTTLNIDMSTTSYSFIRPWFSIQDTIHRSMIGTGIVTDTNPHGISFTDLTSAVYTLYQQVLSTGMVFARDVDTRGIAGYRCTQVFSQAEIKIDPTGDITGDSNIGGYGTRYVEISGYPTAIGNVYHGNSPAKAMGADLIRGTNVVVLAAQELLPEPTDNIYVEFFRASALEPPTDVASNLMSFGALQSNEFIASGGIVFTSITNPTYSIDLSGPFARKYRIVLDGAGVLTRTPQILFSSQTLNSVGTSLVPIATTMAGPARIKIGLTRANAVSGMEIKITLTGQDNLGNTIYETLTFNNTNWVDNPVPSNFEDARQFQTTSQIFGVVNFLQVTGRTNDGTNSVIQMWAELRTQTDTNYNDYCPIAEVLWNGQAIGSIKDVRPINHKLETPERTRIIDNVAESIIGSTIFLNEIIPAINQTSEIIFAEDFNKPRYLSTSLGYFSAIPAYGVISIEDLSGIRPNDSVTIKAGKSIVALGSNANANLGQWNIDYGSLETTAGNIISAINNATFNSGSIATQGAATNNIKLTRNDIFDARGNTNMIIAVASIPGSMSVSGFEDGVDAYGEVFLDRFIDGINSAIVPAGSIYDTYLFNNSYRSRAVPIPNDLTSTAQKFLVMIHGVGGKLSTNAVRIKGAYTSSYNWLPPILMTQTTYAKNCFVATFSAPVYKIQVELFAKATGMTVYAVSPNI